MSGSSISGTGRPFSPPPPHDRSTDSLTIQQASHRGRENSDYTAVQQAKDATSPKARGVGRLLDRTV